MGLELKCAEFSDDRVHRYRLYRTWNPNKPIVLFVGLNPSTADEYLDDPTIRRCINFAKKWGYGSLYMGNIFAYRATDPKELLENDDPVGEDNNKHLRFMARRSEKIIAAWVIMVH